jgi:hypothetical protein
MMEVTLVSRRAETVKSLQDVAAQRMLGAVILVKNATVETLTGQRHGRMYKVPTTGRGRIGEGRSKAGTGVWYRASAPGEAPAVRLDALRGSVDYKVHGEGKTIMGDVGTRLPYGKYLEYGTLRMSARPWLRKTFEACTEQIVALWRRPWL